MAEVDVPTCYANDRNNVRWTLDLRRKTNGYLQSTGLYWKKECSRLRKKPYDAMTQTEGLPPPLLLTTSSFMSRYFVTTSGQVPKANYSERKRLKTDISHNELPLRVSYYAYVFLKQSTTFAQPFVLESCPSRWRQFGSLKPWCPDERNFQSEVVREWHGRCILKENFLPVSELDSSKTKSIGDTFLVCGSLIKDEQCSFNVSSAKVTLYSPLRFYTYPPYNIDRTFRLNFIAQSTLSVVKEEANVSLVPSKQHATKTAVLDFVPQSMKHEKHFKQESKDVFSSVKKAKKLPIFDC